MPEAFASQPGRESAEAGPDFSAARVRRLVLWARVTWAGAALLGRLLPRSRWRAWVFALVLCLFGLLLRVGLGLSGWVSAGAQLLLVGLCWLISAWRPTELSLALALDRAVGKGEALSLWLALSSQSEAASVRDEGERAALRAAQTRLAQRLARDFRSYERASWARARASGGLGLLLLAAVSLSALPASLRSPPVVKPAALPARLPALPPQLLREQAALRALEAEQATALGQLRAQELVLAHQQASSSRDPQSLSLSLAALQARLQQDRERLAELRRAAELRASGTRASSRQPFVRGGAPGAWAVDGGRAGELARLLKLSEAPSPAKDAEQLEQLSLDLARVELKLRELQQSLESENGQQLWAEARLPQPGQKDGPSPRLSSESNHSQTQGELDAGSQPMTGPQSPAGSEAQEAPNSGQERADEAARVAGRQGSELQGEFRPEPEAPRGHSDGRQALVLEAEPGGTEASSSRVLRSFGEEGFVRPDYLKLVHSYRPVLEEELARDQVPSGRREQLLRYFELLQGRASGLVSAPSASSSPRAASTRASSSPASGAP